MNERYAPEQPPWGESYGENDRYWGSLADERDHFAPDESDEYRWRRNGDFAGRNSIGSNSYSGYGGSSYRGSRPAGDGGLYGQQSRLTQRDPVQRDPVQRGRAPKGYTRSDERIREDVCDRLIEGNLDAGEMEVTVHDGEVELKGSAPSREVKHSAERIAASVLGVRDVTNHLRIVRDQSL
ncbi:MAG TPA: BON domain-containing protein [Polyangiaceae bacterium]|jgi:hypothetical protein|nr:BON domain-containing protein [Polyangiaceae bacterium]